MHDTHSLDTHSLSSLNEVVCVCVLGVSQDPHDAGGGRDGRVPQVPLMVSESGGSSVRVVGAIGGEWRSTFFFFYQTKRELNCLIFDDKNKAHPKQIMH